MIETCRRRFRTRSARTDDVAGAQASACPIVVVIDDDVSFRRSTERLLRAAGLAVRAFASAEEFMQTGRPATPACLLLDVRLPDLSGLDLQREVARTSLDVPIIFMTGHGDITMSVQAMKAGAVDFLTKPFREQELLGAVRKAIERDRVTLEARANIAHLRGRHQSLTPREREVMQHVVSGSLNKQIAAELGLSEKTVKFHRGHIMRKMGAESLAGLVRFAASLHIQTPLD